MKDARGQQGLGIGGFQGMSPDLRAEVGVGSPSGRDVSRRYAALLQTAPSGTHCNVKYTNRVVQPRRLRRNQPRARLCKYEHAGFASSRLHMPGETPTVPARLRICRHDPKRHLIFLEAQRLRTTFAFGRKDVRYKTQGFIS